MKIVERVIIKLLFIQLAFLLFFQLVFHKDDMFMEYKRLVRYEGVLKDNYVNMVESFLNTN